MQVNVGGSMGSARRRVFFAGMGAGEGEEVRRAKKPHAERAERAAWRLPGAATWGACLKNFLSKRVLQGYSSHACKISPQSRHLCMHAKSHHNLACKISPQSRLGVVAFVCEIFDEFYMRRRSSFTWIFFGLSRISKIFSIFFRNTH